MHKAITRRKTAMFWTAATAALLLTGGGVAVAQSYPRYAPPSDQSRYAPADVDDEDDAPPPPRYARRNAPPRPYARDYAPRYADPRDADPRADDPRYAPPQDGDDGYAPSRPRAYADDYADRPAPAPRARRRAASTPPAEAAGPDPYADPAYLAWRDRYFGAGRPAVPAPREAVASEAAALTPAPPSAAPTTAAPATAMAGPAPAITEAPAAARPPPPAPASAPAPAPARVSLATPPLPHRLTEAADAYAAYIKRACAIDAAFKSGAAVADAVKTGTGYEAHQFEEGAIAYAALIALKDPAFVAGVHDLIREGDRASDFAPELAAHPEAVLNIPGAESAAAEAAAALHRHGVHLLGVGAQVKQAAYDVQRSPWSKSEVANPEARLAAAKERSATRAALAGEAAPELTKAVDGEVGAESVGPSPVVVRALAVAALASLGQLRDGDDPALTALLAEPKSADCLKMAKLNLFQCLSVSRPHYEDIFCLGQHAMMETGQCVVKAAGFTPAPPAAFAQASAGATAAMK